MCTYSMLIPLNYFSSSMRFGIGWYSVRTFAAISSSLVLIFLLYEITMLYSRLLHAILDQRRERDARLMTGDAVAATMAHEFRQPLAAMMTTSRHGLPLAQSPGARSRQRKGRIQADHRRWPPCRSGDRKYQGVLEAAGPDQNLARRQRSHRGRPCFDARRSAKARNTPQLPANSGVPRIMGDRILLQQVLLNLIANAIDSMAVEDGPRVLSVSSGGSRRRRCRGVGRRHRSRNPVARYPARVHSAVHDQIRRYGAGPVDLPFDYRRPPWKAGGHPEHPQRRRVSNRPARACGWCQRGHGSLKLWRLATRSPDRAPQRYLPPCHERQSSGANAINLRIVP